MLPVDIANVVDTLAFKSLLLLGLWPILLALVNARNLTGVENPPRVR